MARKPRLTFEGAIHHVMFRGNGRQAIFRGDGDRTRFLESLEERVKRYRVRLYLYCLMGNHVHLLLETPTGNLSAFMGSLLTSYAAYFNVRNQRSGHVTQGRYDSPLVEGDEYLLRLSRYIHLNPVFVEGVRKAPVKERVRIVRAYRWSSYRAYAGLEKAQEWVEYGPLLGMMPGRRKGAQIRRFQAYVEEGLVESDEEMEALAKTRGLGIGSESFIAGLRERYEQEAGRRVQREDVSFRKAVCRVTPDRILQSVSEAFGIEIEEIRRHRFNDLVKPVAALLLTTWGGLTQREAAGHLGLSTGAAVCMQIKRARAMGRDMEPMVRRLQSKFNI